MTRRAVVTAVAGVVLLVAAGFAVAAGVDTELSTGGLLVSPVPLTRLLGGWIAGAIALATVAVLCLVDAAGRWRADRSTRPGRDGGHPGAPGRMAG